MASVASRLIEEVTAHAQSDSVEDAQEICADGTYFLNNLRILLQQLCPTALTAICIHYTKHQLVTHQCNLFVSSAFKPA